MATRPPCSAPTSQSRTAALLAGPLVAATGTAAQAAGCVREPTGSLNAVLVEPATKRLAVRKVTLRFFVHDQRGSTRLTACLPRLDTLGGKSWVRRLALRISRGLDAPPVGRSVWRAFFTPVGKGGGAAAYPATVESRGIIGQPELPHDPGGGRGIAGPRSARRDRRRALDCRPGAGPEPSHPGGALGRLAETDRQDPDRKLGVYRLQAQLPARKGTLLIEARVPSRRFPCGGRTADAPAGCHSSTLAGVSSSVVRLRLR